MQTRIYITLGPYFLYENLFIRIFIYSEIITFGLPKFSKISFAFNIFVLIPVQQMVYLKAIQKITPMDVSVSGTIDQKPYLKKFSGASDPLAPWIRLCGCLERWAQGDANKDQKYNCVVQKVTNVHQIKVNKHDESEWNTCSRGLWEHRTRRGFTIRLKRLKPRVRDFWGPQNFGSKDNFQHFCKQLYS